MNSQVAIVGVITAVVGTAGTWATLAFHSLLRQVSTWEAAWLASEQRADKWAGLFAQCIGAELPGPSRGPRHSAPN